MTIHRSLSSLLLGPFVAPASGPEAILGILAEACQEDPLVGSLLPDRRDRERHLPALIGLLAGPEAWADMSLGGLGGALWAPPGCDQDPETIAILLAQALPPSRRGAALAGLWSLRAIRPTRPHWRLAAVGVRRESRRLGVGSDLLAHGLARADRDRVPSHAELADPDLLPLFFRLGFVIAGRIAPLGWPELTILNRPASA